jgi:hypothetical protein
MYSLKIQNATGEIFDLSDMRSRYSIIHVSGLTPPKAAINTSPAGVLDGEFFNSARLNMRNIVLDIVIEGDIETNRQQLYRIFPSKSACTVFFKTKNMNVKIEGYIEVVDGDVCVRREQMQISILCPRPYWTTLGLVAYELSTTLALFEFPFSIEESPGIPLSEYSENPTVEVFNGGSVPCGFNAYIEIAAGSSGISDVALISLTAQKKLQLKTGYTLQPGDTLWISTVPGFLRYQLIRNGEYINFVNRMTADSEFFTLALGENLLYLTCTGDIDDVHADIRPELLFAGV